MEIMDIFFNLNFPDIELPLVKKKVWGHGNRGYGSSLDDYTYVNNYYFGQEDLDVALFIEYADIFERVNTRWVIDEKLEPMYEFFDEQSFELFIKWKFGFDIADKGNKKYNWSFV